MIDYFDKKFYSDFGDNWDDELFRKSISCSSSRRTIEYSTFGRAQA